MVVFDLGISLPILLALGTCVKSEMLNSSRYVIFHSELASVDQETSPVPRSDSLNIIESSEVLTIIIYSSLHTFDVTILSSNGTDLTSSIQILHSPVPLSALPKRSVTSDVMRKCAMDPQNIYSTWCDRTYSVQSFQTYCKNKPQPGQRALNPLLSFGSCTDNKICVGSNSKEETGRPAQAFCISTDHFVEIGQEPHTDGQNLRSTGVVTAGFDSALYNGTGRDLGVEAVVTFLDGDVSLMASSIVMQAQSYDRSWHTVANGSADCLTCSSVTLAPFPMTAQRVKVDVVMPKNVPMGLLWLASYPY